MGIVDDFDGFFQALRVRPGEHDLEFVKEGYHNLRRRIFVEPGGNFRVRHTTMEKLRSGDAPVIVRTPSTSSSVLVRRRRSM